MSSRKRKFCDIEDIIDDLHVLPKKKQKIHLHFFVCRLNKIFTLQHYIVMEYCMINNFEILFPSDIMRIVLLPYITNNKAIIQQCISFNVESNLLSFGFRMLFDKFQCSHCSYMYDCYHHLVRNTCKCMDCNKLFCNECYSNKQHKCIFYCDQCDTVYNTSSFDDNYFVNPIVTCRKCNKFICIKCNELGYSDTYCVECMTDSWYLRKVNDDNNQILDAIHKRPLEQQYDNLQNYEDVEDHSYTKLCEIKHGDVQQFVIANDMPTYTTTHSIYGICLSQI